MDIIEKIKPLLCIDTAIEFSIVERGRDLIEYIDVVSIKSAFILVDIKQIETYNLFQEIEQQKTRYKNDQTRLQEIIVFEKALLRELKKEDRANRLYLTNAT